MDFANTYIVMKDNEKAKGICLMNMGSLYYKAENYLTAFEKFKEGALCAKAMIEQAKEKRDKEVFKSASYLYCKRKYYAAIMMFKHCVKNEATTTEKEWGKAEKLLEKSKMLIKLKLKGIDDLNVNISICLSYCCLKTKRLISAETYLEQAKDLFGNMNIEQKRRECIFILPDCIYEKRILL